jgi:RNA polymerase sigma-70 factor (ECF subfamily)
MKMADSAAHTDASAKLIRRAIELDPAALDQLVDDYSARLHGFLYRLTGHRDEAEELVQEVFLRVVRMIGDYQDDGRFEGWLFRIATNLARDRVRRLARRPGTVSAYAPDQSNGSARTSWAEAADLSAPPPETAAELTEEVDALQRALAKLPAVERETIMLRHYTSMTFEQIAAAMGVPRGTALARSHRGLGKLRQWMEATP